MSQVRQKQHCLAETVPNTSVFPVLFSELDSLPPRVVIGFTQCDKQPELPADDDSYLPSTFVRPTP
jgi:hypothetical protein